MSSTIRRITFTERGTFLTADNLLGPVPCNKPAELLALLRACPKDYIATTEIRVQVGKTVDKPTGVR
jgi:hypothetical protein